MKVKEQPNKKQQIPKDVVMIDDSQPEPRGLSVQGIMAQPNTEIQHPQLPVRTQLDPNSKAPLTPVSAAEDSQDEDGEEEMEQQSDDDS